MAQRLWQSIVARWRSLNGAIIKRWILSWRGLVAGLVVLLLVFSIVWLVSLKPMRVTAASPQVDCGSVSTSLGGSQAVAPGAVTAETCFWQAHQSCRSALLTLVQFAVDTGVRHKVSELPNGRNCVLSDAAQPYSANFGGKFGPIHLYPCTNLQQLADGALTLNCGSEGMLIFPPTQSA